jgi:hypothetical protein
LLLVVRAVFGTSGFFLQAGELAALVGGTGHPPMHVQVLARVAGEGEAQARLQAHVIAFHFSDAGIVTPGGKAGFGERLAHCITLVAAGVVEALVVRRLVNHAAGHCAVLLGIGRVGERVIALYLPGGAHLFAVAQAPQAR